MKHSLQSQISAAKILMSITKIKTFNIYMTISIARNLDILETFSATNHCEKLVTKALNIVECYSSYRLKVLCNTCEIQH